MTGGGSDMGQDHEPTIPSGNSNLAQARGSQTQGVSPQKIQEDEGKPKSICSHANLHMLDGKERIVITSIQATGVALGLRRIPVGFYVVVHHGDLEWITENKQSSATENAVEWKGPIPIPSSASATVSFDVYASFECQPMLGAGERLRGLTTTVGELLDNNAKRAPFTFLPLDGDVVSPCLSISITVEWEGYKNSGSSSVCDPGQPPAQSRNELEEMTDQGHHALSRFRKHGQKQDLERSIEQFEYVLNICPKSHPYRPAAQSNLAMAKFIRCQVENTGIALEVPLDLYRSVLAARPVGHPDRPSTLIQLAAVRFSLFQKGRDEVEAAQAEALLDEVMDLNSTDSHEYRTATFMLQLHAGRGVGLARAHRQPLAKQDPTFPIDLDPLTLSDQFLDRFEQSGDLAVLQQAIATLEELIRSTSVWDDRHRVGLANLGIALSYRFNHTGALNDFEEAFLKHREANDLTPHGHPQKPSRLNNLGNAFKARFERFGQFSDLEDAISIFRRAVDLAPHGHRNKQNFMNNLGDSLVVRFQRLGELGDLEDAISILDHAVKLKANGHASCLNSLGNAYKARFWRLGRLSDLADAISILKDAVDIIPPGHPDKPRCLTSFGNCFLARFQRIGDLSDLEDAILMLKDAAGLTPDSHRNKHSRLSNLGNAFQARFKRLGELSDLEDAISTRREAVNLIPHDHPDKPVLLHNLGNSLKSQFQRLGQLSDLEDAISMFKEAVGLTTDDPDKPARLNSLGNALHVRFERLGKLSDLEDAISIRRDAVNATPQGHPHKPTYLNSLGASLKAHFQRLRQPSKLDEAISRYRDAVDLTPSGHADEPTRLLNLGISLSTRFIYYGRREDLEEAIALYSPAASSSVGPIGIRFRASQRWISSAQYIHHHTLLEAYSVAVSLLPQLAWIGHSLTRRFDELKGGADVARKAAAAALDAGLPETAVEWLEQGRLIVWGELFQLRSSYEELSSAHPNHARRLQELSAALEHAGAAREAPLAAVSEQEQSAAHRPTGSLQDAAGRHRALAIERDKLLHEIRKHPGFERFLLHKEFSQLRHSAHSGPVVMLNAAEGRCDALIIRADIDHVIHVPLPDFTFKRSTGLQKMLEKLLGHARATSPDEREGKSSVRGGISWESLLSTLWHSVVKPILDVLGFSTPGSLSRIFWCPTGPFVFLPIHAAGLYDAHHSQPGHKASDFVISSYVPSLSILAQSPSPDAVTSGDLRLLVVPQPPSDGLSRLPGVEIELDHIKRVIKNPSSARTTLLESSAGTVEEVIGLMKEADWVHFACHGIQDATDSGLCLADRRRLKLRDIITLSRPRGGLAFLSACQTAMGDEGLSDEAIHIAAGMLFAGYSGVVGTMWSISDKLAPDVARDVYARLFLNGAQPDYREAAWALHEAVARLRDSGKASFVTWLPFIHVGI